MSYEGEVRGGTIVLTPPVQLPEGAKVQVVLHESAATETAGSQFLSRIGEFVGAIDDLPADFALNHDHYIHGAPKK